MAGSSSVLLDDSRLSRLDQALHRLESFLALIGGLAVFALMLLAVVSVGGRNFMNQPLPGYVDWIEQAMPLIAFVGIAYCQRLGGHIRMDILVGQLRGRPLWIAEFFSTFAILILMLLLVWGSYAHPHLHPNRLSRLLCRADQGAVRSRKALGRLAAPSGSASSW